MKAPVFAVLLILAGAFAVPSQISDNRDIATDYIRDLINNLAQYFKDSGLDPYELKTFHYEYDGDFKFKLAVQDLLFTGLSTNVINNLYNNILFGTFDFDVVLPELSLTLGNGALETVINESDVSAEVSGSLLVKNVRLAGQARYVGNIIIGVRITGIALKTSIGSIESNVKAVANGIDYTDRVNTFLSDTLHNTLENYKEEINDLLAQRILAIINGV